MLSRQRVVDDSLLRLVEKTKKNKNKPKNHNKQTNKNRKRDALVFFLFTTESFLQLQSPRSNVFYPLRPSGLPAVCQGIHSSDLCWAWSGDHTGQKANPVLSPCRFLSSSPGPSAPLPSCRRLSTCVFDQAAGRGSVDAPGELAGSQRALPHFIFKKPLSLRGK